MHGKNFPAKNIQTVDFMIRRRVCTKCKKEKYSTSHRSYLSIIVLTTVTSLITESKFKYHYPDYEKWILDVTRFTNGKFYIVLFETAILIAEQSADGHMGMPAVLGSFGSQTSTAQCMTWLFVGMNSKIWSLMKHKRNWIASKPGGSSWSQR